MTVTPGHPSPGAPLLSCLVGGAYRPHLLSSPSSTWTLGFVLSALHIMFPLPGTPCPHLTRSMPLIVPSLLQEALRHPSNAALSTSSGSLGSLCLPCPHPEPSGPSLVDGSGCPWTGSHGRSGEGFWSLLNPQHQPAQGWERSRCSGSVGRAKNVVADPARPDPNTTHLL